MKNLIFLLVFFILIFNCKNDDDDKPCLRYNVVISEDNCDCEPNDDCANSYQISESEYVRLSDIIESCPYIESSNVFVNFEGYLLSLNYESCINYNF